MTNTAADILIDTIYDWGVDVIFGLPGDGINGIMEALRTRQDKIRFIQVRHEEAAAFMACAYAKYTGRLSQRNVENSRLLSRTFPTFATQRKRIPGIMGCRRFFGSGIS
jgi:hypothetical protein